MSSVKHHVYRVTLCVMQRGVVFINVITTARALLMRLFWTINPNRPLIGLAVFPFVYLRVLAAAGWLVR